ncbi:MAG TPA: hypothetical protein VFV99_01305 [Kofleriaceae bacterium]|nr:hypothetical protein [Kofleriaceae bacterium]
MRWVVVLCALAGCSRVTTTPGGDTGGSTITLMVSKRIPVHDVASLVVTITNGGSTTSETVQVTDQSFPLNYDANAPGMTGSLDIKVEAFDAGRFLVGRGTTTAELGVEGAAVMLQGVDFTLNSVYAGNQFLTNDFETVGLRRCLRGADEQRGRSDESVRNHA